MLKKIIVIALIIAVGASLARASSHSEAPGTAAAPNADLSDLYAFQSYEAGKSDHTVFIMNALPLSQPNAGPNYSSISDKHMFALHIDANGDAVEDSTFEFFFGYEFGGVEGTFDQPDDDECDGDSVKSVTAPRGVELLVGTGDDQRSVAIPLKVFGSVGAGNEAGLNWFETFQISHIAGPRDSGVELPVTHSGSSSTVFKKPFEYIGEKAFGSADSYDTYARQFVHSISIPGCASPGRVFVGARNDPFYISLGKVFDLVNLGTAPVSSFDGGIGQCQAKYNELADNNVVSIALEVPTSCIVESAEQPIISVWSSVRKINHNDVGDGHVAGEQVSRLAQPLVNELAIGLRDKFKYSKAHTTEDGQFATYVTHPTLPEILSLLFTQAVRDQLDDSSITRIAPTNIPRNDLLQALLIGVPGLNRIEGAVASDQLRLNTAIAPRNREDQDSMGVLGGDAAGMPNGRRVGDDAVDISLRVFMGALCNLDEVPEVFDCSPEDAPFGSVAFTDGVPIAATDFADSFPFLNPPKPGSIIESDPGSCDNGSRHLSAVTLLSLLSFVLFFIF